MEWQAKWGLLSTAVVPRAMAGNAGCSICKQTRGGIGSVTITAAQIQRPDPLKKAPVRVGKAGSERVMLNLWVCLARCFPGCNQPCTCCLDMTNVLLAKNLAPRLQLFGARQKSRKLLGAMLSLFPLQPLSCMLWKELTRTQNTVTVTASFLPALSQFALSVPLTSHYCTGSIALNC